jgi:hypothetical protein
MIETKDIPGYLGGRGETDYAEHSYPSRSKKVIYGPLTLASDPTNDGKSIDPIQGTVSNTSASLALLQGKAYRVIASTAVYFRLTSGSSTAVVGDVYLPANTPIVIETKKWDTLSFIQVSSGGVIQAVEVL